MKKLMMGLLLTSASFGTQAIDVNLNVTCGNSGGACNSFTAAIQQEIDSNLPDVSLGDYGVGIANANGFVQKGLGSDYTDVFTYGMVRLGFGGAIQGDIDDAENAEGVGFGAAATIGINLTHLPIDKIGPVDFSRMDLFVSLMSYNADQDNDDMEIEAKISTFSIMARYRLLDGEEYFPGHMLTWGGVYLHTGLQRSSFEGDMRMIFDNETVDVGGGQTATFGNASADFSIETTTTSIPIEISTYLRTIWALTLSAGAGFDLVSGSTDASLEASGTISGDGASTYSADLDASESDSGDADATNFRAFGGLQLNLPFVRVFTHVNKGLGNDLIGVNAGVKILW